MFLRFNLVITMPFFVGGGRLTDVNGLIETRLTAAAATGELKRRQCIVLQAFEIGALCSME